MAQHDDGEATAGVAADDPDVILVRNLQVQACVGVLAEEHGRSQGLRFDIEIETVPDYARIMRETRAYVSYADAVAFIEAKAATGEHVELVETWAEAVAACVLENPLVAAVTVTVTKPDIFPAADGVGIRIRRRRTP